MTRLARAARGVFLVLAVVGCGARGSTFPPLGFTPGPAGDAASATKALAISALAAAGLQAVETVKPYRPPEGPLMTGAPRSILQVQLPDDPEHGQVVIYSLGSAVAAERAAFDQAAYIASNPGKVQFAPGSHFVLRTVDTTVIFFTWTPGAAPDQRTGLIEQALNTLGTAVPIPG
jgi:hypothetical protein